MIETYVIALAIVGACTVANKTMTAVIKLYREVLEND